MNKETLRMQMLSGIITESEYKAKLKENKKLKSKKPLNENFVGIGAINNPFLEREKTDYEMAFEHFTKGTSLNEVEDEMPEIPSHEETDANQVYEAEGDVSSEYLKEFKIAISKIMSDSKFKDVEEALGLNIDANGRNMGEVFQKVWDKAIKL